MMENIKTQIFSLLKKKAMKNGVWLYLLQIFNTIVPLLTLPYITRIMTTDKYGSFSIALNIYGYLQVLVEYGFGLSATRKMVQYENDIKQADKLFSKVFFSRIFLSSLGVAISILYAFIFKYEIDQCICLLIMALCSYGYCLQLNWFFQGIQDMKYISITSILGRTVSVICIFVFVKSSEDLFIYAICTAILPIFSGIIGFLIANKKYGLSFAKVRFCEIWNELKDGFLVFTASLSSKVFGAIGITFLGILGSKSEVGIYSAVQKIPNLMMLAWAPIAQVLYPISSKKMGDSFIEGKKFVLKTRRYILALFIIGTAFISIFSNLIVKIAFGEEYAQHSYWIIPLLGWLIFSINNNFLGHQILLGGGFDKEYSKCFQIGIIITVVMNFVFIYFLGGDGACVAPLLSELCLTLLEIRQIHKIDKKRCSLEIMDNLS